MEKSTVLKGLINIKLNRMQIKLSIHTLQRTFSLFQNNEWKSPLSVLRVRFDAFLKRSAEFHHGHPEGGGTHEVNYNDHNEGYKYVLVLTHPRLHEP